MFQVCLCEFQRPTLSQNADTLPWQFLISFQVGIRLEITPFKKPGFSCFGSFPLVLAYFLGCLACFDGGDVCRQQPMRNCLIRT